MTVSRAVSHARPVDIRCVAMGFGHYDAVVSRGNKTAPAGNRGLTASPTRCDREEQGLMQPTISAPRDNTGEPHSQLDIFASTGVWTARRQRALPIEEFPAHYQEHIARLVALPKPPPRWLKGELFQIESRAWWEWHWQRGVDPDSQREPIPSWIRQRVYERDGYRCLACGSTKRLSLDHIIHWSAGGRDTVDNLRTLCTPCNSSRGTKSDVEWRGGDL